MRNIVESVRLPHARRWFEGLLRLLVANNRAFCPREAKMNDYSQSRLTLPARGERRSCQGGCLHAAKSITLACAFVHWRLLLCAGVCFCAPVFASVGHAAVLPVHFFLPLFNLPRCGTTPRLPVSCGRGVCLRG